MLAIFRLIKKHPFICLFVGLLFLALLASFLDVEGYVNLLGNREDKSFLKLGQLILGLSALLTIVIAVSQLFRLNNTAFADLLFKIESRYGSAEILDARALIQKLIVASKDSSDDCPKHFNQVWVDHTDECKKKHLVKIQDEIRKIGKCEHSSKEFALLLNFLDFMESISYYSRIGYLDTNDVIEMFGGNLPFWYDLYSPWIEYRRWKYNDKRLYCEFEDLVCKIKHKHTCCLIKICKRINALFT